MLLIYTEKTSPRLQYACKFIFEELLGTGCSLTLHEESFHAHDGVKINYSHKLFSRAYHIKPVELLFESGIQEQNVPVSGKGEHAIFFVNETGDHSFDIFAAVFYLISRYEEYLPHTTDSYGRYAHENSIAFKNDFLNIPLVNIWVQQLGRKLQAAFPTFTLQPLVFKFLPTYDIDIAWSFKEKGLLRNAAGFLKAPSLLRLAVLSGLRSDPYNSYEFLDTLHKKYALHPVYFFLVAKRNGFYDKHILPSNIALRTLISEHARKYETGLHPSWKSNEHAELVLEERRTLENISKRSVTASRQHYIKMSLPETYQTLIAAGIKDDYSMGYGSINGFRASAANAFFWYDLSAEKITALRIHPFCFMDANCFYEQKLSPDESYAELMHYYAACKNVTGTLITIFHNNFLGSDKAFAGWPQLYEKFIDAIK